MPAPRDIEDVLPTIDNLGKSEEYLNIPMVLTGVEWRDGNFGEWAIIHGTIANGEEIHFSCGSSVATKQLRSLEADRQFPVKAVLMEKKNEKTGRTFMEFVSPNRLNETPAATA
jgi:hypothetical protein